MPSSSETCQQPLRSPFGLLGATASVALVWSNESFLFQRMRDQAAFADGSLETSRSDTVRPSSW